MTRAILRVAIAAAALLMPGAAQANHAGCLAHTAAPSCQYVSIGAHQCLGYAEATWQATVVRNDATVTLASGQGAVVLDDVNALPGETVTLTINADGPGNLPLGAVSCGNTSGHLL